MPVTLHIPLTVSQLHNSVSHNSCLCDTNKGIRQFCNLHRNILQQLLLESGVEQQTERHWYTYRNCSRPLMAWRETPSARMGQSEKERTVVKIFKLVLWIFTEIMLHHGDKGTSEHMSGTGRSVGCVDDNHKQQHNFSQPINCKFSKWHKQQSYTVYTWMRSGQDFLKEKFQVTDRKKTEQMSRVQTPGYVPKKTRWVFWVHPPKKTHPPKKPTLLL